MAFCWRPPRAFLITSRLSSATDTTGKRNPERGEKKHNNNNNNSREKNAEINLFNILHHFSAILIVHPRSFSDFHRSSLPVHSREVQSPIAASCIRAKSKPEHGLPIPFQEEEIRLSIQHVGSDMGNAVGIDSFPDQPQVPDRGARAGLQEIRC